MRRRRIEAVAGGEDSAGGQFRMAPVGSITPGAFQPRINFDKERLAELTLAIQSQGIIEPLIVRRIDAPENRRAALRVDRWGAAPARGARSRSRNRARRGA